MQEPNPYVITEKIVCHEAPQEGAYFLLYGAKAYQWIENPDEPLSSRLLEQSVHNGVFTIIARVWTLQHAFKYIHDIHKGVVPR